MTSKHRQHYCRSKIHSSFTKMLVSEAPSRSLRCQLPVSRHSVSQSWAGVAVNSLGSHFSPNSFDRSTSCQSIRAHKFMSS